jgi:CDP-diacylglycerol--glycerol-3-phosphate 3-phosphatidyltransferase
LQPLVGPAAVAGIRPNQLTVAAVAVSALAGIAAAGAVMHPMLIWAVPVLYLLRMALNAMDGMLARRRGMESTRGAILNEVGDVVSDALAYLPFALYFPARAGLVVVVVVLGLIAEVTALAATGGTGRRNDGPLGKSDRALAFGGVAVLAGIGLSAAVTPVLVLLGGLGCMTIWNRARADRGHV